MSTKRHGALNVSQRVLKPPVEDQVNDWALQRGWFDPLHARFGFTVDVAAAVHNAQLPRYYTLETDGLAQSWAGERVWCNPPYSDIGPWIRKGWAEHAAARLIVMIVPASRTEQGWWHTLVEPYRDRPRSPLTVEFIRDRQRFVRPGQSHFELNNRPPFGCCLLIWHPLVWRADDVQGGLFDRAAGGLR